MKKKTPEQEVEELCKNIRKEIDHWEDINQYGCSDPFYPKDEYTDTQDMGTREER